MINAVTFKSTNPFNYKLKKIQFGKVNTIIGTKGGGKSTLYDLLANAKDLILLSTVKDALAKHQLEVHSITINGEEISGNSLSIQKVPKKIDDFKKDFYKHRNDVIYQDDPIKKNLSNSTNFDTQKMNFAKNIVANSEDISHFIMKIQTLYNDVYKVRLMDKEPINFLFSLKATSEKRMEEQIIFDLNYTSRNIHFLIRIELAKFNNELSQIENQMNHYNKILLTNKNSENLNHNLISSLYITNSELLIKNILKNLQELKKLIIMEINKLKLLNKLTQFFAKAFNNLTTKIKEKSKDDDKFIAFESVALNHFKKMGELLNKSNQAFNEIINSNINFEINETIEAGNLLDLVLKDVFTLEEDQKFDMLKTVLYNAKRIQTNVENWIQAARNNDKEKLFDEKKIINALAKIIKDKIKVLADGYDYDQMSLGQRSIYGIRYKFEHSKSMPLFLDQPEDNLDNYTIAQKILKLIIQKHEQLFIVTHNANIGILSQPDKVIVACFNEDETKQDLEQYLEGTIINQEQKESDSAYFLEGGAQKIMDRLKIIKGED